VQHSFALVWIERRQSFLRGPFPGLDLLFIFSEQGFALFELLSRPEPRGDLLGDAEVGNLGLTDLVDELFGFFASEPAIAIKAPVQSDRNMIRCSLDPKRVAFGVGDNVDDRRLALQGLVKEAAMSGLKVMQGGLDMFAGAQAVDAEINAGAEAEALAQTTDLYSISHAASGTDPEVREDGVIAAYLGNAERFQPSAEPALVDLVRIGGSPVMSGWNLDFRLS
jgi:hypothetical protein